ncbi:MAG: hypothetical protein QOG85_2602 [Gaiellaceae bacterium]|nr:hypothetical protein [Gaiellaceae bacterium]
MGKAGLVVICALVLAAIGGSPASTATGNAITIENARTGTTSWYVDTPRQDEIAGYFDHTSYLPGASATLYVDSKGDPFSYTVYRIGYYQGLGGRKIASGSVASNAAQPESTVADDIYSGAKLLKTGWHSSAVITLGTGWVTGYYLVKLHDAANGGESYANFVLRSATPAPIVVNLSTNTWQAYNLWGDLSLYRDARVSPAITNQVGVAHQVSFLRPYSSGYGAGLFFLFDRPLVAWAESHGYPVSYSTDDDVRHAREAGAQTKLVIFSGHSEYYSMADRNELNRLTTNGVSEAFFGGNAWAWQARFNDTTHVMTVWRDPSIDPSTNLSTKTIRWVLLGLPQDALTGTMETWGTATGPQAAYATTSWPWNGAGVVSGADLGPLEGNEFDGIVVNSSLPKKLLMLSRTPFSGMPGVPASQAMTVWQTTPTAFVFAAGQTNFNWNLAYPGGAPAAWIDGRYPVSSEVKPAMQRLAGNLLARATGIANPIPVNAPKGAAAPFAILAPQSGQYVMAAPNPLSVSWSDPPAGTATIEVSVDGVVVSTNTADRNVRVVSAGINALGSHTIAVAALSSTGDVLAKLTEPVIALSPADAAFSQNQHHISRMWG